MRNLITAQEVIELAFAENSNMMAESISDTAIRIAEIKYIRPAFGAMYPFLADKYADFTNDYVKPALAYFVKCEIVSSIAIDMSNSGVAVANPQYQSAASDKQRQRLYDSEMSKAKTLLDFALEYIATHSEEFPDFSGEAPKKHHRLGGLLLGDSTSRNQPASIAGEAFKNEIEQLSKEVSGKVDKVEGKGLSTNDYTDADKALVQTIPNKVDKSELNEVKEEFQRGIESANEYTYDVEQVVNQKPNKEGYYPDMSVGMADNLVGRGDTQNAYINFRPSAGADNITDGAARIERIKGNSVVCNQLAQNADFRNGGDKWSPTLFTFLQENDYVVLETTAKGNQQITQTFAEKIPANHKILIICDNQRLTDTSLPFMFYLRKTGVSEFDTSIIPAYSSTQRRNISTIINTTAEIDSIRVYPIQQAEAGTKVIIYSIRIIDLTKEFGAEVANNITSYEDYLQLKPMNIEDEYAYNAGTLVDMKVNSLISTSDNAYDYTKGYARVMGGYKYDITANAGATLEVSFYADGEDDNEEREIAPDSEGKYTFPANGICYVNGDFASQSDVCVCLNHSYDKPHPAYQQEVKDLSWIWEIQDSEGNQLFPEGMRSAGNVCDEIRFNPTKKVWEAVKRVESRAFAEGDAEDTTVKTDGAITNYPLATPIVVELDYPTAETNMDYLVWDFGTEEAIVPNNVPSAPFRADINYEPNAVDDLRWAVSEIRNLKAQLAQMNASVTNLNE